MPPNQKNKQLDSLTAFEDEVPWGASVFEVNAQYVAAQTEFNKMMADAVDKVLPKKPVTRNFLNFVRI